MAVGLVILISIAIALGIVFLLVLLALLIALRTRDDHGVPAVGYPVAPPEDDDASIKAGGGGMRKRPSALLATLNAATAKMALSEKTAAVAPRQPSPDLFDDSNSMNSGIADVDEMIVRTRFSFHAEQEGELTVGANEELVILDSQDPDWCVVAGCVSRLTVQVARATI